MNELFYQGKVEGLIPKLFSLEPGTIYDVRIKKYKPKRSLNANNFTWSIITQIAEKMSNKDHTYKPDEIYRIMLKDYGQSDIFEISSNINLDLYFKYYDVIDEKDGMRIVRAYIGSSQYNTEEMNMLTNGIIQEAKNLGINVQEESSMSHINEAYYGKINNKQR